MRKVLIGLPLRDGCSASSDRECSIRKLAHKGFNCSLQYYEPACAVDAKQIIDRALCESADLIFIDSGVEIFEDTIERMLEVAASDPIIAFVSPRLNDPASHALPLASASSDPREVHRLAQRIAPRLPEATYVPNVIASCFYARHEVMCDLDGFESDGDVSEHAINELVIRANRRGYRAVIANRAYAHSTNARTETPPDALGAALDRHLTSPAERALALLCQCETDAPLALAFDFSSIGTLKNGTSEYSVALVSAFAKLFADPYRINVLCEQATWDFHDLAAIPGLRRVSPDANQLYAAIVRTNQPFTVESLTLAPLRGAVTLTVMHDAIAYDCLHVAPADLHELWSFVMQFSDGVIYVSQFSRQQFARRFATSPDVAHIVCMPSTDAAEYATARPDGSDYLLIVGNDFEHKALQHTVDLIRAHFPALKLAVFGSPSADQNDVIQFPSGKLSSGEVASIFANARAVVYPSHYEGFGLPIMHALANEKRIFARDLPVYHELRRKVAAHENIQLFKHDAELLENLAAADFAWRPARQTHASETWKTAARHLAELLARKLETIDARTIERRLAALDLLTEGTTARRTRTELQKKVAHLENIASHHQRHLAAVHDSFSWRVTKGLRALGRLLPRRQ
jgi:glycosyltransferase involved in cell wall biosynthesis